ncbi:MAG: hypothetical protein ABSD77_08755 [Verrucomicrobiota bacterium]|jgi:hypothetical protein
MVKETRAVRRVKKANAGQGFDFLPPPFRNQQQFARTLTLPYCWRNFSSLRKLHQAFLPGRFGWNLIFPNKIRHFYAFSHGKIPPGIVVA